MKLNVWQILGVVLIVGALAYMVYQRTGVRPATPIEPAAPPAQQMPPDAVPSPTTTAATLGEPFRPTPIPMH